MAEVSMTVDVNAQILLFTEVFKTLWQDKAIVDWQSESVDMQLLTAYTPFYDLAELTGVLPNPNKPRIKGEFGAKHLWLRSDSKMQPMVHLKFDFSRNLPEIRIRLGLFLKQSNGEQNSFGLRYESPEGTDAEGKGIHHYYHVQLIRGFKKDKDFTIYQCPTWLPVTQPALPLPANDSVSLLLCFISSLYGMTELQRLLQSVNGLRSYFETHPFRSFDPLCWYRMLTSRKDSGKHYYKVSEHPDSADPKLRNKHQNHDLAEITMSDYDKAPKTKRNKL
ncbi:MAG: hypothetical protein JNM09_25240 [Blastocatellia bacterium]|nr:hypothetical protein [Blastocatellia bacterium]